MAPCEVVKHDRDCIRRRDRAPNLTVPMKLERPPPDKAKVQSLAAAVHSKALEMAAASQASAAPCSKTSRA